MIPPGCEAGQERFLGELGFRDRAEAALRDLKGRRRASAWLDRRSSGEGPEDRASSLVVVIVSALERLAGLLRVLGTDHEQVIRVEDERTILVGRGP